MGAAEVKQVPYLESEYRKNFHVFDCRGKTALLDGLPRSFAQIKHRRLPDVAFELELSRAG